MWLLIFRKHLEKEGCPMKHSLLLLLAFYIALFSAPVNAVLHRYDKHLNLDEELVKFGADPAFDSVGHLRLFFQKIDKKTNVMHFIEATCSGTLIDARTVMATADCIEPMIRDKGYTLYFDRDKDDNTFTLGKDVAYNVIARSQVESAVYYEGFSEKSESMDAQNIALLYLSEPILEVKPAPLYEGTSGSLVNKTLAFVGFGFAGNPEHGVKPYIDYQRRACEQTIIGQKRTFLQSKFENTELYLSGMFTHGDQGGAAFVKDVDGIWKIAGINAFRHPPSKLLLTEEEAEHVKNDQRYVTYGTLGYSLAIPFYRKWIRKNAGVKIARRIVEEDEKNSEWSFRPYWSKDQWPQNQTGNYFKAILDQAGTILIDKDLHIDELVMSHKDAKIYLPRAHAISATEEEVEETIDALWKKKSYFEAIEYRRCIERRDEKFALKRAQLTVPVVTIDGGSLHVDGELITDQMTINNGILMGIGEIIHSVNPVTNRGGVVAPGTDDKIGTLIIWSDYQQLGADAESHGGTLKIKVNKHKTRGGVRITSDILDVKGQAHLAGCLEIVETNLPLEPGDKVKFLLGLNGVTGKFDSLKTSNHHMMKMVAGTHEVSVEIVEREQKALSIEDKILTLGHGQSFVVPKGQSFDSITVNGGLLSGDEQFSVADSLLIKDGMLQITGDSGLPHVLAIDGAFAQTGGALSIKVMQAHVQTQDGSERPIAVLIHDALHINGEAHLGGQVQILAHPNAVIADGTQITIVRADRIEGRFASINSFPGLLQPQLSYTDTEVKIIFTLQPLSEMLAGFTNPTLKSVLSQYANGTMEETSAQGMKTIIGRLGLMEKSMIEPMLKMLLQIK